MAAGVDVVVLPEADHGRAPHPRRLACDFLHDLQEPEGARALLGIGDDIEEGIDNDCGRFGFQFRHDANHPSVEPSGVTRLGSASRHSMGGALKSETTEWWDMESGPLRQRADRGQGTPSGTSMAAGSCNRRMTALPNAAPTAPSSTRWSNENDRYTTSAGRIWPAASNTGR